MVQVKQCANSAAPRTNPVGNSNAPDNSCPAAVVMEIFSVGMAVLLIASRS
jgi:hypothetical protein